MSREKIPLIRVNQWLRTWDKAHWDDDKGLGKPSDHFFVGAISLEKLRALAGVTKRDVEQRKDPKAIHGYQRAHEEIRSRKINRYVKYGYPLSTSSGLSPEEHEQLINPGWLPNAIIVNIIPAGESRFRNGEMVTVPKEMEVTVNDNDGASMEFPSTAEVEKYRLGRGDFVEPIEIIDGQHRLFASDYSTAYEGDYDVPVVVFNNLSLGWQAYLFWTINVEPKKINASLAFDLYPELRRQEWLDQSESIKIYQEHRSQEMTEILWSHSLSPWNGRIELHGKRVRGHVSNAAFIRSLNSSFIKKWVEGDKIGGLFGSLGQLGRVIPWNRAQQAAFLIRIWSAVASATKRTNAAWAKSLENESQASLLEDLHPAFAGPHTLIATDQGVRAIHSIFNAIFQHEPDYFELDKWRVEGGEPTEEAVTEAFKSFQKLNVANHAIKTISSTLVDNFDWRLSTAPGLEREKKKIQASYRGSSGYGDLLLDLVHVLTEYEKDQEVRKIADAVGSVLVKAK